MTDKLDELNERFKKSAEDFSLLPSDNVWKNVGRDIRKRERKRRFIIFFFVFTGILIGATGLFLNQSTDQNTLSGSKKSDSATTTKNSIEQNKPVDQDNIVKKNNSSDNNSANNNSAVQSSFEKNNAGVQSSSPQNNPAKQSHTVKSNPENNSESVKQVIPAKVKSSDSIPMVDAAAITGNKNSFAQNKQLQTEQTVIPSPQTSLYASDSLKQSDSLHAAVKRDSLLAQQLKEFKEDENEIAIVNRWTIAFGLAPALSFSDMDEQGDYQFVAHYRDSSDKDLPTLNAHFAISYKINPHCEIFSGLGLVNFQQEILHNQVVYRNDTLSLTGPVITPGKGWYHLSHDTMRPVKTKFAYLQIPVGLRCNVYTRNKFSIWMQPQFAFNLMIRSSGYTYDYDSRTYREFIRKEDLRQWNFSYGAGASFQYAFTENLSFALMPGYHIFLRSIYNSSTPLSQKFQQAELRFSLHYILPK
ncbi:MAG: PorT family protein [Bacteroidota bacterium]|nr:PorT family protein [Bacteroidota bacterium]